MFKLFWSFIIISGINWCNYIVHANFITAITTASFVCFVFLPTKRAMSCYPMTPGRKRLQLKKTQFEIKKEIFHSYIEVSKCGINHTKSFHKHILHVDACLAQEPLIT